MKKTFFAAVLAVAFSPVAALATTVGITGGQVGTAGPASTAVASLQLGPDPVSGYELRFTIPNELILGAVSSAGDSTVTSIDVYLGAPGFTQDPVFQQPNSGFFIVNNVLDPNEVALLQPGPANPTLDILVAGTVLPDAPNLLNLQFFTSIVGSWEVSYTGFLEELVSDGNNGFVEQGTPVSDSFTINVTDPSVVPLPAPALMLISGLIGLAAAGRRRATG